MRKPLIAIFLFCLLHSCQNVGKTASEEIAAPAPLKGVWELTDQYFYENKVITDSSKVPLGFRHIKIFATSKYMWSNKPNDSIERHAYGSYEVNGNRLIEEKEYSSRSMEGHSNISNCRIIVKNKSYTQIFLDSLENPFYAEKYMRIE